MRALVAAFVAVLAVPAAAPAQQGHGATPARQDWARVVVQTPEGGFRMGNPDAAVKVVEYFSLTCSHCANFAREAAPNILNHVRTGRVSFEYRNFVLNGLDLSAAMLSRCAGPQNYFQLSAAMLAAQEQWMARVQGMTAQQQQQMRGLTPLQTMQRVASIAGLESIAAQHGVTAQEARACLSDQAGLDRLVQMQQAGQNFGVQGTPTFAINGQIAGTVHNWATLEPLLRGR